MEGFPEAAMVGGLQNTWHSSAISIYRNWLQYVVSKKAEARHFRRWQFCMIHSARKRSAL